MTDLIKTNAHVATLPFAKEDNNTNLQEVQGRSKKRDIAEQHAVTRSCITKVIAREFPSVLTTRNRAPTRRVGRPCALTPGEAKDLCELSQKNPFDDAGDLVKKLQELHGKRITRPTIRAYLKRDGIEAHSAVCKPLLNAAQRRARLQWARTYRDWDADEWRRVIFSDESVVSLLPGTQKRLCYRRSEQRLDPKCVRCAVKFPTRVMVWGGIMGEEKLDLSIVDSTLDSIGYMGILRENVLPFINADSDRATIVFQQDNAPCHKARRCTQWFKRNKISVMVWPPNSADLSPIENLWHVMKQRVCAKTAIKTRAQLIQATEDAWASIEPGIVVKLIDTMPRRVQAVLKAKGGPIDY